MAGDFCVIIFTSTTGAAMRVFVYFNLHKKVFSIRALEGPERGRVVGHRSQLTLTNVTFRVSEAGRQRVLREQRKNVHAGVVGQWFGHVDQAVIDQATTGVTYNPYRYSSFVYRDDQQPITTASAAHLKNREIFVL
jgi:hypothetical protein